MAGRRPKAVIETYKLLANPELSVADHAKVLHQLLVVEAIRQRRLDRELRDKDTKKKKDAKDPNRFRP